MTDTTCIIIQKYDRYSMHNTKTMTDFTGIIHKLMKHTIGILHKYDKDDM